MIVATPVSPAPIAAVVLTAAGATDGSMVKIDFQSGVYRRAREFFLTGKTVGNATAPGSTKTLTLNYYWSDDELDPTTASTVTVPCANRKTALSAVTLPNSVSATRQWNFSGATALRQQARFLYLSLDMSTLDSGATETVTVNFVPAPSTAVNL